MNRLLLALLFLTGVSSLNDGQALLPPMGWMSWAAFYCEVDCVRHPHSCINEQLYMDMADHLVSDGFLAVGYRSIHIDDCWMESERTSEGKLLPNRTRFPSGIKALSAYMHARGLELGIYEDYGTKTCAGYPGSLGFIKEDAATFADWDVDYLKLDGCNVNVTLMQYGYPQMSKALNNTGKRIVYSCEWPDYLRMHNQSIDYAPVREFCHTWRNFDDVENSWSSILSIVSYYDHNQDVHVKYNGPGGWFDPDMLVAGNGGITVNMARAQLTMWCLWSAPLIMSTDLRALSPQIRAVLQNKRVIAVDQDPMGKMARLVLNSTYMGVYTKPVTPVDARGTSFAIGILNRDNNTNHVAEIRLSDLGLNDSDGYRVDDLWEGKLIGIMHPSDTLDVVVEAASANLYKATPVALAKKVHRKKLNKKKN